MKELTPFTSLFDDTFFRDFFAARAGSDKMPAIDVHEEESRYRVKADLPGVAKDDIKVTLENGVLTISAETHSEETQEKEGRVIRRERHEGRYSRSFSVGSNIDPNTISAKFDNGVLTLDLPKLQKQAPTSSEIKVD